MKIGVGVPCYKRPEFTKFCVPLAIRNAGIEAKWYLVDDRSNDETFEFLLDLQRRESVPTKVTQNFENMGIAMTRNMIFKMMLEEDIDIFVNIDNDLLLPTNWLRDLVLALAAKTNFHAIGPWFVNDNNINNSLKKLDPLDLFGNDELIELPIGGGCVLYRREIFEEGIFYPDRKANWQYQDSQYHGKIRAAGYRVGLYTGVQAWLLERIIWNPMEEDKLKIRHATLNKGSLDGFEENLERLKRRVPFGST